MREVVADLLKADEATAALLTGGIYSGTEISKTLTPAAFDANGEILPCALVALEASLPYGPYLTSYRQYFTVTCWQRTGYDVIDAALERAYALLNNQQVGTMADHIRTIAHTDDSADLSDMALGCSMRYSRFVAYRWR